MTVQIKADSITQRKLWEAAMKGDSAMIRILSLGGADLDARNEDGMTAFALATQNNHAETAMTILAAREAQFMKKIGAVLGGVAESADIGIRKTA